MTDTRTFPIADVLTITTGRLLAPDLMTSVYRVLDFLTGDQLMTHQLGRALEARRPQVIEQHPWLGELHAPPGDDALLWVGAMEAEHPEVELSPIPGWEHRDPIEEAVEMFGADKVIAVVAGDE